MILTNAIIFITLLIIVIFLKCFYRNLCKNINKKLCNFKLSKTRFIKENDKVYAIFSISLKDKNQFFVDFPLVFRFYADTRFKAKVKIKYEALRSGRLPEEIIDKVIEFESKTIEYKKRITDIIVGEIQIEVEMKPYYGNPILEFEILQNSFCTLDRPFKKIIKFPKKNT